jgi:hypothetical protein
VSAAVELLDGQLDLDGREVSTTGPGAQCSMCPRTIPAVSPKTGRLTRSDADTCSKQCRQAKYRLKKRLARKGPVPSLVAAAFGDVSSADPARARGDASPGSRRRAARARELADRPVRVAYADPPYIGKASTYYGRDGDPYSGDVGEVDHVALVARLEADYPDGWALSCSAASLSVILPLLPPGDWHLCPWVKQLHPPGGTYGLHTCWECLVVVRGRQLKPGTPRLAARGAGTAGRRDAAGRKPLAFCAFLFDSLGLVDVDGRPIDAGDELHDLFPGTGIVGRAWAAAREEPVPSAA